MDFGENCILVEGEKSECYKTLIEKMYTDKAFYDTLCENANSEEADVFRYGTIAQKVIDEVK